MNLKDNSLEAEAGLCFAEAIPLNHTIIDLNLSRNPMPYKFIVEIQKAIDSNRQQIKRQRKPNF